MFIFQHVKALFLGVLIIHALLCIATIHSSLLSLRVQVVHANDLDLFHDLASSHMLFQSMSHAHILAFAILSKLRKVGVLCLKVGSLCMPP